MKLRRLLIALAAIICIVFSSAFVNAAESQDKYVDNFFSKMIGLNLLEEKDIIDTDYMQRGDFVRLAMKVAGVGWAEQGGNDMYNDLESTGINRNYINTASQLGYISGEGGSFYPNAPIKFNEAIKIMTEILGYGVFAANGGGYPEGYLSCANRSGLMDGLKAENYDALTLSEGLKIIDAALDARVTEKIIQYHKADKVAISEQTLAEYLNIGDVEGVVSECGATGLYSTNMYNKNMICIDNVYMTIENPHDFDNFLGMNCKAYYRDDEDEGIRVLGYLEILDKENNMLTINAGDAEFTGSGYTYDDNGKEKTAKLSSLYSLIYNGQFAAPQQELMNTENGFIKLIDNDDDNKYDVVFVYNFTSYILDDINVADEKLIMKNGEIIEVEEDSDNYIRFYIDGVNGSIDMLSSPVVVSYAESLEDNRCIKTVYVSTLKVSGDLTTVSDDELTINGQKYKTYESFAATVSPNITGDFYIDSFERVVYYEAGQKDYDYGYLMNCWRESDIDDAPCGVKIYNSSGVFEKYQLADKCVYNNDKKISAETLVDRLYTGGTYKQFIRYRFDENGLINSIETAKDLPAFTDEGEQGRIKDVFRISDSGSEKFYISNYSFNMRMVVGPATKVFFIPTTGNEDHFKVTTRANLTNDQIYTYTAYNADEYGTAEFVVCTIDYRSNTSNYYIVKRTYVMLDENGEECNAVQCYANGTLTDFKAADTSNFSTADMKKGDIIQVYVNAVGKVETFNVLWRYSKDDHPEFALNGTMSSDNIVGGEVVKLNRSAGTLVVRKHEDYYIMTLSPSMVTVYDSGEWSEIPSGDITIGDYVVFKSTKSAISSLTVIK